MKTFDFALSTRDSPLCNPAISGWDSERSKLSANGDFCFEKEIYNLLVLNSSSVRQSPTRPQLLLPAHFEDILSSRSSGHDPRPGQTTTNESDLNWPTKRKRHEDMAISVQ